MLVVFKKAKNRVLKEVDLLQKLQHRHIVAFLGKEVKEKVYNDNPSSDSSHLDNGVFIRSCTSSWNWFRILCLN